MWKNVAQQEETDDIMVHGHFTLDTQGYKHTLSEYVILIAFPKQQWLYKAPLHYVIHTLPILFKIVGDVLLQRYL
jgi:hypothetical protein